MGMQIKIYFQVGRVICYRRFNGGIRFALTEKA